MRASVRSGLTRYGAAVVACVWAAITALLLQPLLEVNPFPILLAAVTFSAWYGGMGPGLVATVLGTAALDFLFFAPTFTLTVHYWTDVVNLAVFALVALLISSLNERLRRARQRAEQLAAERQAILGQIADGVVLADPSGAVTYVNDAARRLRYDEQAAFLDRDGQRLPPTALPLARAIRGEGTVTTELRIPRPEGSEAVVEAFATPVVAEDGARVGAVMTLHDVTVQRALERQKDEFLANVSHDLRTPLTAIKHSIEVVLANEPPGTPGLLHELFENVQQSAERMAALVDDLLELARLRAGMVRLSADEHDLRDLAVRAARAVEPLARTRGQRLDVDLPTEPVVVEVDGPRLERALLNLLGNAHKYGRADGTITLRVGRRPDEVVVAVSDDGPGIPVAEQGRIFERFYRVEGEATRHQPGSGLGLPIARALVELHGGRVWVESAPGAGATFCVALPRAAA